MSLDPGLGGGKAFGRTYVGSVVKSLSSWGSVSSAAKQDNHEGLENDLEVPDQRPILRIVKIQFDHVRVINFAPASHLPGTSESWHHLKAIGITDGIQIL